MAADDLHLQSKSSPLKERDFTVISPQGPPESLRDAPGPGSAGFLDPDYRIVIHNREIRSRIGKKEFSLARVFSLRNKIKVVCFLCRGGNLWGSNLGWCIYGVVFFD